jgi:hypothetical protein
MPIRGGLQHQAERPGRGLTVAADQAAERAECLRAGHLLLEDRGDERLDDGARSTDPQPDQAAHQVRDDRVARHERGRVVVEPDQRRERVEEALRARPPRFGHEAIALVDERHRGRSGRRPCRPPDRLSRQAHRRIARSAQVRAERQREIEWSVEWECSTVHERTSLSRFGAVVGGACFRIPAALC